MTDEVLRILDAFIASYEKGLGKAAEEPDSALVTTSLFITLDILKRVRAAYLARMDGIVKELERVKEWENLEYAIKVVKDET